MLLLSIKNIDVLFFLLSIRMKSFYFGSFQFFFSISPVGPFSPKKKTTKNKNDEHFLTTRDDEKEGNRIKLSKHNLKGTIFMILYTRC